MKTKLEIENLKCSGCENSIIKALASIDGVKEVLVNHELQIVEVTSDDGFDINICVNKLAKIGYPQRGEGNQFQKIKSYVSCAVGKIN